MNISKNMLWIYVYSELKREREREIQINENIDDLWEDSEKEYINDHPESDRHDDDVVDYCAEKIDSLVADLIKSRLKQDELMNRLSIIKNDKYINLKNAVETNHCFTIK